MAWHYIAARMNGDGTKSFLDFDLPLSGAEIVDELSGPGSINGSIAPEIARLRDDKGRPVIEPWSTAVFAEEDGVIRGGALVTDLEADGPNLKLTTLGFPGYLAGMPYDGEQNYVGADPLDIVRDMWAHVQSKVDGNLGVQVDTLKSTMKVGTSIADAAAGVGTDAGPYQLNWWSTFDLGKDFTDLATMVPFDYRMDHWWEGEDIKHKLVFGVPVIGRRRHDLRFAVGENVISVPTVTYSGDTYASGVILLGAGEGRKMIRSDTQTYATSRLRRVSVLEDKSIKDKAKANSEAQKYLKLATGQEDITEITVLDHPHAPFGSYRPGDEILVETADGWYGELALWCRVLSVTTSPEAGTAKLSIARVEKVA